MHGSDDYIRKDSASLLRLKIKLEKTLHVKTLKHVLKLGMLAGTLLSAFLFYWLRAM